MRFEVLVGTGAGVTKHVGGSRKAALPPHPAAVSDDVVGAVGLAVDAPVQRPMLVADRDGEAAVVCPYQRYELTLGTGKAQLAALASVRRLVERAATASSCTSWHRQKRGDDAE